MTCVKPSKKEKVLLSQCIKADCLERQVETEIMDSVMGPAVYDSRIRPSGINGTGRTTAFSFYPQQSPVERKYSVALLPSESLLNQGIFQMELHLFTSMFLWGVFQPLTTLKWWVPDCSREVLMGVGDRVASVIMLTFTKRPGPHADFYKALDDL